jgi:putative DNA primase/helicase
MSLKPVSEVARGRWRGILPEFGIDPSMLTGKQGPCPICGGATRFRFDDREGRGTWICNHCQAGDGMSLVMKMTGLSFADAARRVEEVAGEVPVTKAKAEQTDRQKRDAMTAAWRGARPVTIGDPVDLWLRNRLGEVVVPPTLRFADRCRHLDDDGTVSWHPAMLARVTDPEGKPVNLHRTYLTHDGHKADVSPMRKTMPGSIPPGSAVRLAPIGPVLGIAEGIENAFAAMKLFGIPAWAALNEGNLAKWRPPEGVSKVLIFADNDANFVGQSSGYLLARRIANTGVEAEVMIPDPRPGEAKTDWNNVLQLKGVKNYRHVYSAEGITA